MKILGRAFLAAFVSSVLLAILPAQADDTAKPPADDIQAKRQDLIESRLTTIEAALKDIPEARAGLLKAMSGMLAEKKISKQDVRAMCVAAGNQTKMLENVGQLIATLERPQVQAAMTAGQRERLTKAHALADATPSMMDCSSIAD